MKNTSRNRYVPSKKAAFRALISGIPYAGGALDHLIFDKADEISAKNIELSINQINDKIKSLSEEIVTKKWFESSEALEMFKQLMDKVQFEPDEQKIKTLADIYAISGTEEFASDPNKFVILRKAAELSSVQKELLIIASRVNRRVKKVDNKSTGTVHDAGASWEDDIMKEIKAGHVKYAINTNLNLHLELGILESLNLIMRVNVEILGMKGYEITELGKLLVRYYKA